MGTIFLSGIADLKLSLEPGFEWISVLYVLCGLGVFLFGIDMMGGSLKALAGNKMRVIIEKSTNTPLKGMLVGFLVTMLTQSASGTSALAVGLVASGLMTFPQALGVLLGANIGGTILTIILAVFSNFKIMPIVSVILVAAGALTAFFSKKKNVIQIGSVILGFGLIFLGLAFIDMGMKVIQTKFATEINDLFGAVEDIPVLGLLIGTIFTFVVQSSSATIGIVQGMFSTGAISLKGALAIMLGANIGTTITALIASMGSNKSAKRVALANILIKLFGAIVFIICFSWAYYPLVDKLNDALGWTANPLIISLAHLAFNIINSFVFLFLLGPLTFICYKFIKGKEEDLQNNPQKIFDDLLDYSLITRSTAFALTFVKTAINYMAKCTQEYVHIAKSYSFKQEESLKEQAAELEKSINCLDKRIHDYLIKLTMANISDNDSLRLSKYLDQIKDLERVGDHCTNLFEFFSDRYNKDMHLSDDGAQDLEQMFGALLAMTDGTVEVMDSWDASRASEISLYEEQIDQLEEILHERHIHRVNSGACSFANTEHYVEILSNIERMGDHLENILDGIISKEYCKSDEYNH